MTDASGATPNLNALAERLANDLSVEHFGYEQLGDLADERQRAIVCDQILITVDAVTTNLREARDHAAAFVGLVGPNGRAMPDPDHPEELQAMHDLDRELVGFFRAAGSIVDCLAGAAIGILRLPLSIQKADAGVLSRINTLAAAAAAAADGGDEASAWTRAAEAIDHVLTKAPDGWFEWMLEMRNAVVHRARQLRIWLPRSSRGQGAQFIVRTEQPLARLLRYEPHLRHSPWMPDLGALSAEGDASDNWLAEPATSTVPAILARLELLTESVAEILLDVWEQVGAGELRLPAPVSKWPPEHASPERRVAAAQAFTGFDPDFEAPPLTAIVMNPREARRAQIAEGLRRM